MAEKGTVQRKRRRAKGRDDRPAKGGGDGDILGNLGPINFDFEPIEFDFSALSAEMLAAIDPQKEPRTETDADGGRRKRSPAK